MPFDAQKVFDEAVAHYTARAQMRGWFAEARHQVHQLEKHETGLFLGIRAAVGHNLRDFDPPRQERGEWWLVLSEHERLRKRRGR